MDSGSTLKDFDVNAGSSAAACNGSMQGVDRSDTRATAMAEGEGGGESSSGGTPAERAAKRRRRLVRADSSADELSGGGEPQGTVRARGRFLCPTGVIVFPTENPRCYCRDLFTTIISVRSSSGDFFPIINAWACRKPFHRLAVVPWCRLTPKFTRGASSQGHVVLLYLCRPHGRVLRDVRGRLKKEKKHSSRLPPVLCLLQPPPTIYHPSILPCCYYHAYSPYRMTRVSAAPAGRAPEGTTTTGLPRTPRCSTTPFRSFLMVIMRMRMRMRK